tara:strand:+ start:141 stop:563 length:423 start_codon:yes stop_codon:yes gene_type:complete
MKIKLKNNKINVTKMTKNQYELTVNNNDVIKEEGSFFKAGLFKIKINDTTYIVDFKQIKHTIYYIISEHNNELVRLIHPDYVPDCNFEDLNDFLNNDDAQTLFAALCRCHVSIKKEYLQWLEANPETLFSYQVIQPLFLK